jgi:hypothetical protein
VFEINATSLIKQQFVVKHTIHQTGIPALLGSRFTNIPSVKIFYGQKFSPYSFAKPSGKHRAWLDLLTSWTGEETQWNSNDLRVARVLQGNSRLFLLLLLLPPPPLLLLLLLLVLQKYYMLNVSLLRICQFLSVSCKTVYRLVTTNCCFMSGICSSSGQNTKYTE